LNTGGTEWSNTDLQQDVSEAEWVDYNLDGVATTTVGSLVPTVFDAYARIAYPARGSMSRPIPSKPVARWQDELASTAEFSLEARKHPTNAGSPSGKAIPRSTTYATLHRPQTSPATTTSC
jgi:hypothetical protein